MPINDIREVYDRKIQFYNRLYRITLLILNIIVAIGVFIVVRQISINVQNTKAIINNNQNQTIEARKLSADRQLEMKAYIKCLVLYSKRNPGFNMQIATLEEAEKILDQCASDTSAKEK